MSVPCAFEPRLDVLPEPQRRVFRELGTVPRRFVLYGGTAITLRLGHRRSLDFGFFSNGHFQPDALEREIPLLRGAVRSRSEPDTLVSVVERSGPVTGSFFGRLLLRRVGDPGIAAGDGPLVASLLDLAATKVKVVQDRAEAKDYLDVACLLAEGIALREALGAALAVYGPTFNPLPSLKALAYFEDGDLPSLSKEIREALERAVRETPLATIRALPPRGGLAT
ncbi:MAG: nucleotidyl transferase AbiEii/AbiGii toxin family protein [Candidatus Rokubacteria bacterium]|nr:nucleotidyl transferase AbiEii/AbiGii toxin family protein [Candidatus Rokubacteria bacterium]